MCSTIMGLGLAGGTWDWDSKERSPTSGKASSAGGSLGATAGASFGASARGAAASFGASAVGAAASFGASARVPVHELGIAIPVIAAVVGEDLEHRRSTGAGELSWGSSGMVSLGS